MTLVPDSVETAAWQWVNAALQINGLDGLITPARVTFERQAQPAPGQSYVLIDVTTQAADGGPALTVTDEEISPDGPYVTEEITWYQGTVSLTCVGPRALEVLRALDRAPRQAQVRPELSALSFAIIRGLGEMVNVSVPMTTAWETRWTKDFRYSWSECVRDDTIGLDAIERVIVPGTLEGDPEVTTTSDTDNILT